ncbi:MAG: hypothetical protein NTW69_11315 [Chloroflexi bacterium]|nr:hypothetical protein [Chloroflexota bacterium]
MNSKRFILQIIGLTLTFCLLAGCGSPAATPTTIPTSSPSVPVDFTGNWYDSASLFSLDLSQTGDQLQGTHGVVAQNGNKIDSLDNSIKGSIQADKATIIFQSSFASDTGTAQITFIDANTIYWKIITPPSGEYYLPVQATLIKKSPAANPSSRATSTIMGNVHLMAPPVPSMTVYAVDQTTGEWGIAKTEASDSGIAPFNIVVPPGTYLVYGEGVGYSLDSLTLTPVTVTENQTVSEISVGPPSQFECGSMMGYPAAPDGSFAAIPGPSAECIATSQASSNGSTSPQTNRIQFQPNATSWQTSGDIARNGTIGFVLYLFSFGRRDNHVRPRNELEF